jgi:hypothetical protein
VLHEQFQLTAPFSAKGTSTAQALLQLASIKDEAAAARSRVCLVLLRSSCACQ